MMKKNVRYFPQSQWSTPMSCPIILAYIGTQMYSPLGSAGEPFQSAGVSCVFEKSHDNIQKKIVVCCLARKSRNLGDEDNFIKSFYDSWFNALSSLKTKRNCLMLTVNQFTGKVTVACFLFVPVKILSVSYFKIKAVVFNIFSWRKLQSLNLKWKHLVVSIALSV